MTIRREIAGLAALITGAVIIFAATQKPISFDGGRPWDASIYHDVARQFAAGLPIRGDAPFVFRIGEPAVAGLVAGDHISGFFHVVDLASATVGAVLLWVFLRWHVHRPVVRLALVAVFLVTYVGPLRFGLFFPGLTYPVFWCFLIGGLCVVEWSRARPGLVPTAALAAVMFAGTVTRETMLLLVPVVVLARPRYRSGWQLGRGLVTAIAGGSALVLTHTLVSQTNSYTFADAARQSLDTLTVSGVVVACVNAYGALLIVVILDLRRAGSFLRREPHLAVLMVGAVTAAMLGGTNTELFLLWGAPTIYVVAGHVFESRWREMTRPALLALLVAVEVLASRLLWPIPDFPGGADATAVLTAWGSDVRYLDLWSKFADGGLVTAVAVEFGVVVLVALIIFRLEPRRVGESADRQRVELLDRDLR